MRRTHVDSRIREQEFGNLQGEDFKSFREEQSRIGRFFYRFLTGENGADVLDRTQSWWDSAVARHNDDPDLEPVKTVLVFTHGLTMRLILMQLYNWNPQIFSQSGMLAIVISCFEEGSFSERPKPIQIGS